MTAADRKLFETTAHDWGSLATMAKASDDDAAVIEPSQSGDSDAIIEVLTPQESEAETAAPEASDTAETTLAAEESVGYVPLEAEPIAANAGSAAAAVDPAHIEQMVREALEQMIPQIVDRIQRTVEITLKREE